MLTIVSNNCYGVGYEKSKGIDYTTPFFSMYIVLPDYVQLLEHFNYYMSLTPSMSPGNISKYYKLPRKYPVLLLEDIEIHMSHDTGTAQESIDKWLRRRDRMSKDKTQMFVKMCDREKFNEDLGKRFLALLDFPNKKLFVSNKWKDIFNRSNDVQVVDEKYRCPIGTKLEKLYPIT